MSNIIAKNSKGETRIFNQVQWNLLGKNKEGWEPVTDQSVVSAPLPSTGEKEKAASVDSVVQKVSNEAMAATEHFQPVEDAKNKEAFVGACEGITKTTIKDYFDKEGVQYDNA